MPTDKPKAKAVSPPPSSSSDAPAKKSVEEKVESAKKEEVKPAPERSQDEIMDMEVFEQILSLDEEDDCSFSRETIIAYFKQATTTFDEIAVALEKKDILTLKDKGHYLKGSSAMLGIKLVSEECEKIQNAAKEALAGKKDEAEALEIVAKALPVGKAEQAIAVDWIKAWYRKNAEWEE